MNKLLALIVAALALAAVSAFQAAMPATRAMTRLNGYVPDGITEAEYEAMMKKDAEKKVANKGKFAKGKKFETLDEWMIARDAKYPGQLGAGHRMAKVKDQEKPRPGAARGL